MAKKKRLAPLKAEQLQPEAPPRPRKASSVVPTAIPTQPSERTDAQTAAHTAEQTDAQADAQATDSGIEMEGGDTATAVLDPPSDENASRVENRMHAKHRWIRENRLQEVEAYMDQARSGFRDAGLPRHRANDLAWQAAMSRFPPPGVIPSEVAPADSQELAPVSEGDTVKGMGEIPSGWPSLAENASLQSELGWVQSQRLRIVEERGNSTVVHLERASTPAPSMSALGWLETSIRSYAKYVDVVAKTLAVVVDEQDSVRRERLRLDEIQALLEDMHSEG